jgi:hypothetical protein
LQQALEQSIIFYHSRGLYPFIGLVCLGRIAGPEVESRNPPLIQPGYVSPGLLGLDHQPMGVDPLANSRVLQANRTGGGGVENLDLESRSNPISQFLFRLG